MKSNLIKKLRKRCDYYEVSHTWEHGYLGPYTSSIVVLARNYREAVRRACKRNDGWGNCNKIRVSPATDSKWKVKLVEDNPHWGCYLYFK